MHECRHDLFPATAHTDYYSLIQKVTILIAEDDEGMRRVIKSIVSRLSECIYESRNGREAVAQYSEHRPDWVLMDIKLPLLDGIEATRQIRAAFPEARVVMVTNSEDHELQAAARNAGACGYVAKRNLLELLKVVE
jgi:CheY-like chemotaxis protein